MHTPERLEKVKVIKFQTTNMLKTCFRCGMSFESINTYWEQQIQSIPRSMSNSSGRIHGATGRGEAIQTSF